MANSTKNVCLALAFASLVFSRDQASASGKVITILAGSPTFINRLGADKVEIEKETGLELDIKVSQQAAIARALVEGFVDEVSVGATPQDAWEAAQAAGVKTDSLDNYDYFETYTVAEKIAVNPENPVTKLSDAQIGDLISGRITSWETITGEKRPVTVVFAKNYSAGILAALKRYNNGKPNPAAQYVIDKDGLLKKLKADPGAIGLLSSKEELADFKPKYFDAEASHPASFVMKKKARPEARKVYELMEKVFAKRRSQPGAKKT